MGKHEQPKTSPYAHVIVVGLLIGSGAVIANQAYQFNNQTISARSQANSITGDGAEQAQTYSDELRDYANETEKYRDIYGGIAVIELVGAAIGSAALMRRLRITPIEQSYLVSSAEPPLLSETI